MTRYLPLLGFILIFISSCNREPNKKIPPIDPAFTGYVSAFTSGVISNTSSIQIRLREIVNQAVPGEELDEDLFQIIPSVEGKLRWVSQNSIEFTPNEHLPSGKLFEVSFRLGDLIEVPEKLEILTFQFETLKQHASVNFEGLEAYDDLHLEWQRLKGQFVTADYAEYDKVEQSLKATQDGKKILVKWEHAAGGKSHMFTLDSVSRGKESSQVILEWDGTLLGAENDGEEVIEIPALGDFKVIDMQLTQQPEQFLTLYFSDPLMASQELNGLIYLKSGDRLRLVVEGNKVKAYPTARITRPTQVEVTKGVKSSSGYHLKEHFLGEVKFSNLKPTVELVGDGVILPSTDGLIFPFKAVNLNAVNVRVVKIFEDNVAQFLQINRLDGSDQLKRVGRIVYKGEIALKSLGAVDFGTWNTFALDLSKLISVDPGSIYRVTVSFTKNQSLFPCSGDSEEGDEMDFLLEDPEILSYDDNSGYYYDDDYYGYEYDYDDYDYNQRDNPCHASYYMYNRHAVTRNVLASDLGIIAKKGSDKELLVAVTDLKTTNSLAGVTIEIYNLQHQIINSTATNGEGIARIPVPSKPYLLVAKQGSQRGYLRLDDGSSLSMSMFDVGGSEVRDGLKGFIYGERGVWRPGDSLYVSFMLEDKLNLIPDDHPIVFELYTPEDQLYIRKVKTRSVKGLYDFRTATDQESPTGDWRAKVKVGGTSFTKTLKIETVKPNRLKINFDFEDEVLKSGQTSNGNLQVKWLHGATARNLNADIEVTLVEGKSPFKKYQDYTFSDPAKQFEAESQLIFDGAVDEQGQASISTTFQVVENAPGMLQANFKIRAFEQGGDFSVDRFSKPYSPYSSYVGVKIPEGEGWHNALYSDEANLLPIVTLNEAGKPVSRNNLKIEVYNIDWRWWWERGGNENLAGYIRKSSTNLIKTDYISTGTDGKALYEMNLDIRSWGRKLIRITDPVSGHSTGEVFYTSYRGWWSAGQEGLGGAEMLTFKTNKETYGIGENVEITLPVGEEGRALVTLESGAKVIDAFWVDSQSNGSTVSFETTAEMTPNVFVHIAYIQPHNLTANDLPIRMYGVQNINVENSNTHSKPIIKMPDVLEPEKPFVIKVAEEEGKGMAYTVAVVDDGLLDLTRYKTPDPWDHFFQKEALGVKTWDMYQYVVGALSGELSGLLALGGDDELVAKEGTQKANRFKPVVKFAGPFYLKPGETASHRFTMPNYVGSVRAMVVAGGDGIYGKTEKTVPVKKPLMVLTTLPRVIGPGETVKVPVTVFALDDKIKTVKASIKPNEFFDIKGTDIQTVRFTGTGDQVIYFDLMARKKIGIGKVQVEVSGHGERATHEVEMDVRLANPPLTRFQDVAIEPGQSWSAQYNALGVAGTNTATLEVSSLPSLNLESRLDYLIRYPHGCIEQTTSSVFPQLYLDRLLSLTNDRKDEIEHNIRTAIDKFKAFQLADGGLAYWPGYYQSSNEWGTNYGGHFLLEAEAAGYTLPVGFKQKWVKFQTQKANEWIGNRSTHRYAGDQLIQAYRLYTLALSGNPALGAMNRMKEINNLSTAAKWRLAAAYQLAGRNRVAQDIVQNVTTTVEAYRELSHTYGSQVRDQAMILETLVLLQDKVRAKQIMDELVGQLGSNQWHSTQTVSYTLLAIAKFVGNSDETKDLRYTYEINGNKPNTITLSNPINQHDLTFKDTNTVSVVNGGGSTIFVRLTNTGIPLTSEKVNEEHDLQMSVTYFDLNDRILDISTLEQGTDFIAEVTVSHPGTRLDYEELALTQIFPSGWEIRNIRMDLTTGIDIGSMPEYQDIRDDRVNTYFDLRKGETKTFRVILNAAYLGKFYLPAVYCAAMYDEAISAYKEGQWIEVTTP